MYCRHGRALCAALGALVALAIAVRSLYGPASRNRYERPFMPIEIAARSESLCRLLAPNARALRLSVIPCAGSSRFTPALHRWVVDAADENDAYAAYLVWDADAQDLVLVGRPSPQPLWSARSALCRREAIKGARIWLDRLGILAQAPEWRLDEPPIRSGNTWFVTWRGQRRVAIISVDALSGRLIGAKSEHLPMPRIAIRRARAPGAS